MTGFKKLGVNITLADAKIIVSEADTDGDGRVSYEGEPNLYSNNYACIAILTMYIEITGIIIIYSCVYLYIIYIAIHVCTCRYI